MWNKVWRISKQDCKTSTPPPDNQQKIKDIQLNFEDYLPQQKNATAINPDRVDWKMLETLGLSKDKLEQDGKLDKILNWQKTNPLPISIPVGETTIHTETQMKDLLTTKCTTLIKGFQSKAGKKFNAHLILRGDGSTAFEFDNSSSKPKGRSK